MRGVEKGVRRGAGVGVGERQGGRSKEGGKVGVRRGRWWRGEGGEAGEVGG